MTDDGEQMKVCNKTLGFLVGAVLLTNAAQVSAERFSPQHEQVKKRFQSSEEKTAKDAIWTQRGVFKVGAIDDGTPRVGHCFAYNIDVLWNYHSHVFCAR